MLGESKRVHIGFLGCAALQLGNIIGTGIYSAPTSIIDSTGSIGLSLCVWVIVGLISTTGALVYAEIASILLQSGGDARYAHFISWYQLSFVFTIGQIVIFYPVTTCSKALAFSQFLSYGSKWEFSGQTANFYANFGIAATLILLLLAANIWIRADWLLHLNILMAFVKVGFLFFIVIVAFVIGNYEYISNIFAGSNLNPDLMITAAYGAVFSFEGYDLAALSVEELKNPKRNLPLSTFLTMSIVICLYVLINIAYALLLGREQMLYLQGFGTIQKVLNVLSGRSANFIMPLIIAICLINSVNLKFFGMSRIIHSMARVKILPNFLSCYQEKVGSPRIAYIYCALISIIMLLFLNADDLTTLNQLSVTFQWFQRVLTTGILLYIRIARLSTDKEIYRTNILLLCFYFVCVNGLILGTIWIDYTRGIIFIGCFVVLLPFYFIFCSTKGLKRFDGYSRFCDAFEDRTNMAAQIIFGGNTETIELNKKK